MNAPTELLTAFRDSFVRALDEEMGVEDFLHHCKGDRMAYASAHECVLEAIGKPPKMLYDGSWTEWGGRPDLPVETQ